MLYNTNIYVKIALRGAVQRMATKKRKKKTERKIEKKRQKLQKKETAAGLPAGEDRYSYGAYDFKEYNADAFRKDGYTYTGPKKTGTSSRLDIKRERRRAEADVSRITPKNRSRLVFGFGMILFLMTLLIFRMGYWQIVRADELRTMAAQMQKVDT